MEINEIAAKDKFEAGWSENTKEKVASSFLSFMRKAGFFSDGDENLVPIRLEDAEFAFYLQINQPYKTECLMRNMTLEELYDKLCSEEFKNTENDIFYNFFIYQYLPQEEYAMRKKIKAFKTQLIRPVNYVDVLTVGLFKEFYNFLDGQAFGKKHPSYLKYMLEKDCNDHDAVTASLTNKVNSSQFYQYLHERIMRHISIDDDKLRPYCSFMDRIHISVFAHQPSVGQLWAIQQK